MHVQGQAGHFTDCLFVTGATGFLGREFLRFANAGLSRELVALARSPGIVLQDAARVVTGDLLDESAVLRAMPQRATVVHLAFQRGDSQANHTALAHVIAAARARSARRIVHCSTALVVGRTSERWVTEASACRPITGYERAKLALEHQLRGQTPAEIELVIVRPTAVVGPGGRNLIALAQRLLSGNPASNYVRSFVFGRRHMNLVSSRNVAAALLFAASEAKGVDREVFLVSDEPDPLNTYAGVERLISEELRISRGGQPRTFLPRSILSTALLVAGKQNAPANRVYSSARIRAAGYRPVESLEAGIRRFARAYCSTATAG